MYLSSEGELMNPKVSVLVPVYNHEKYLKETIDSVLNQTFEDFELLINDDCSTDNSSAIINSYTDKRIKSFVSKNNCGTVLSLNKLVTMAKGEYIAVLGSDDVWLPEKLERQLEILENNPEIAASFTIPTIIDGNSQPITQSDIFPLGIFEYQNKDKSQILFDFFISGNHFCHSSALIRTSVHRQIGLYNPLYRQLHDFDLWIRILLKHNVHISDLKLVKYRFVQNTDNLSASVESNNIRLYNEAKSVMLYLFNNISDRDFICGFKDLFKNAETKDSIGLICEKFLILQEKALWNTSCKTLPVDFISNKLNDEVVERLEIDYGITIKDIYNLTGSFCSNYYSQAYQEIKNFHKTLNEIKQTNSVLSLENANLTNQNSALSLENANLIKQNQEILSSTTWKLVSKIAAITSKLLFWRKRK